MTLAIAATPVGVYTPRTVQLVVTGLTAGADYEVVGSWAGGSWPVRAGTGTATGAQLVLSDIASPVGVPVTWTVTHNGATATSSPLTVDYPHSAVLQSLAGDVSVRFRLKKNGAPLTLDVRGASYSIPGRPRPVRVYDIAGGESGQFEVDTDGADTGALKAMLKAGAPLLLRTNGDVVDLDAVMFVSFTSASSALLTGTLRRWTLGYDVIDDPEPDTLIGLPTWDDFDASYAGLTWADLDAEWAGQTWSQFDVYDWATRAAS